MIVGGSTVRENSRDIPSLDHGKRVILSPSPIAIINIKLVETYLISTTTNMIIKALDYLGRGFIVREPTSDEYVQTSHPDEMAVCYRFFELGLRFPLDTVIANILNAYNIMLAQLMPISFGLMVGFIVFCKRHGIDLSITLFRYFFFHKE